MDSAGLELTKPTYTRLEDNLIRHRGDRYSLHMENCSYRDISSDGRGEELCC